MMRKILLIGAIFILPFWALGQIYYAPFNQITVKEYNKSLPNPFTGGLNCPQYNAMDLNQDTIMDLVVFDRIGNHIYTFINNNIPNNVSYTYSPSYEKYFPNDIKDWMLLRDYNCDGIMDIFSHSTQGVQVYKGSFTTNNQLSFAKTSNLLFAQNGAIPTNIFVSGEDIPAIDDIDNDGDIDILAVGVSGIQVVYYRSLQVETYGQCNDSLTFILDKYCWGKIEDTIYRAVKLNITCFPAFGKKHSGNTLTTIDIDGDGDKDCLKGTVAYGTLNMLYNGGDSSLALITQQDTLFPSPTTYYDNYNFASSSFLDVNNDTKPDLLAACNDPFISNNLHTTWYYQNNSATDTAAFVLISDSFMNADMIDVGEGAYPAIGDIDGDGLADMLLGNYGFFKNIDTLIGSISYYKNIGSVGNPIFSLQTKDWMQLSSLFKNNLAPTIADLNNDGLQDVLLGEQSGELIYIENSITGYLAPVLFYQNIDIGTQATPQLIDLDEDGDFDLVIGNASGQISYYKNIGTAQLASFLLQTNNLGNVDVTPYQAALGYSTPHFTKLTQNSPWVLFCGNIDGHIAYYNNISNNLNGAFTLVDSSFSNIHTGYKSSVVAYNWVQSDTVELLIGNYRGGVSFYKTSKPDTLASAPVPSYSASLLIYPNPSATQIVCTISNQSLMEGTINIYNITGQSVLHQVVNDKQITMATSQLANGCYYLSYIPKNGSGLIYKKLIIIH